jgi:hypothetical protein
MAFFVGSSILLLCIGDRRFVSIYHMFCDIHSIMTFSGHSKLNIVAPKYHFLTHSIIVDPKFHYLSNKLISSKKEIKNFHCWINEKKVAKSQRVIT